MLPYGQHAVLTLGHQAIFRRLAPRMAPRVHATTRAPCATLTPVIDQEPTPRRIDIAWSPNSTERRHPSDQPSDDTFRHPHLRAPFSQPMNKSARAHAFCATAHYTHVWTTQLLQRQYLQLPTLTRLGKHTNEPSTRIARDPQSR